MATQWIETLLADLKEITDTQINFAEPNEEPGPKDHVVGVADRSLRRLRFLMMKYKMRALENTAAMVLAGKEERDARETEVKRLETECNLIRDIFWVSCRAAFPDELWKRSSIGIRKGWKVVWSDPEEDTPENILGSILLGGGLEDLEDILRRIRTAGTETAGGKTRLN